MTDGRDGVGWSHTQQHTNRTPVKTDYFKSAIKAAVKELKASGDTTSAHRIASEICQAALPGKPPELWFGLGWQATLAARNRLSVIRG